jgi:hypothetical protein
VESESESESAESPFLVPWWPRRGAFERVVFLPRLVVSEDISKANWMTS